MEFGQFLQWPRYCSSGRFPVPLDSPIEPRTRAVSSVPVVLWLIAVAVLARAWVFVHPETAVYWWRPADNASIARNFYEGGMHLLSPQVDWGGAQPGLVEMEFPILQYLTAVLYLVFGLHEGFAAVVPVASALGAVALTYRLGREIVGARAAVLASLVLALSTSFIRYSEVLLGETLQVLGVVAGLYGCWRWAETRRWIHFWIAGSGLALAILIKPTALVLGLPVAVVLWQAAGWRALTDWRVWALAAVMLVPPALWYWHAYELGSLTGNTVGIFSGGYLKLARTDLLTSPEFYLRQAWFVAMYHLTPLLLVPLAVGTWTWRRGWLVPAWIAAGLAQIVVAAEGNHASPYYQLIMLPALALVVGAGLETTYEWMAARAGARTRLAATALAVAILVSQAMTLWRSHHRTDFVTFGRDKARQGRLVAARLEPGRPIIYAALDRGGSIVMPRGAHSTPPDIFYFSHMRGWFLALDWITRDDVETLVARGARYFVVSEYWGGERAFLEQERPEVWRYLTAHHPRVIDEAGVLAFDLGRPLPSVSGDRVTPSGRVSSGTPPAAAAPSSR